tara:strand:- start:11463 stop:11669 length:207 start_codon:yes stop_codon:yes gene_type:complete
MRDVLYRSSYADQVREIELMLTQMSPEERRAIETEAQSLQPFQEHTFTNMNIDAEIKILLQKMSTLHP